MIPKKIHFVFLSKDEPIPQSFTYFVRIAKDLHPDWEVSFYNEDDARSILEHEFPELVTLYYSYPVNVQRADILRVLIVYLYGGFYLDMDMYCLKKLDPLLKYGAVLAEEKIISAAERDNLSLKHRQRIANYMFGSKPKHSFWLELINLLIARAANKIRNENDVLETTGPGILTDLYHASRDNYTDIVLLNNNDRQCLNEGHAVIGCHFGNYAAHLHAGTWRWQHNRSKITVPVADTASEEIQRISVAQYHVAVKCPRVFYLKGEPGNDSGTKHIYFILKSLIQPSKKEGSQIPQISVFFDLKTDHSYENNIAGINVFIGGLRNSPIPADIVMINKYFKHYITFCATLKQNCRASGIKIPVHVISPAFKRLKREFYEEYESLSFTVGCFAWTHTDNSIADLISSVTLLAQCQVKNIRLRVYDPYGKFASVANNKYKGIEFCYKQLSDDGLSYWFKDIALMVFGATEMECSLLAMKAIYLGIPVITPQTDNYNMIRKRIKSKALITLNITGVPALSGVISDVYERYDYFNKKATDAANRIEDVWTSDELKYDFLQLLSHF